MSKYRPPRLGDALRDVRLARGMKARDVCERDRRNGYFPCMVKETVSRLENRDDFEAMDMLLYRVSKALNIPYDIVKYLYDHTVEGKSYPLPDLDPAAAELYELLAQLSDVRNRLANALLQYRPEG